MDSRFVVALTEAVNGVKKLEESASIIVSAAVDDLLLRIAKDHKLDFSKLVADYKDDIVETHTVLATEKQTCRGHTATKKPCSRQAVAGGYCRAHATQGIAKKELDTKGVDYAAGQENAKKRDPLAASLKRMNVVVEDSKAFKVSKTEVTDFF
jgi:hypothetical protein